MNPFENLIQKTDAYGRSSINFTIVYLYNYTTLSLSVQCCTFYTKMQTRQDRETWQLGGLVVWCDGGGHSLVPCDCHHDHTHGLQCA